MSPKLGAVLALVVAIGLSLTACGPAKDSPEGVVRTFFDRLEDQDSAAVKDLLCKDFRQNVDFNLGEDQDAKYKFDFRYKVGAEDAATQMVEVKVFGKAVTIVETEHVRREDKVRRDEDAAWKVKVFKVDGRWHVCGADPDVLSLLNTPRLADALD